MLEYSSVVVLELLVELFCSPRSDWSTLTFLAVLAGRALSWKFHTHGVCWDEVRGREKVTPTTQS
jgi:hypothetical protein